MATRVRPTSAQLEIAFGGLELIIASDDAHSDMDGGISFSLFGIGGGACPREVFADASHKN